MYLVNFFSIYKKNAFTRLSLNTNYYQLKLNYYITYNINNQME